MPTIKPDQKIQESLPPCRVCGSDDSYTIRFLTRWPEIDLCIVCWADQEIAKRADDAHD